jgi:putative phosphoesterase
MEITDKILGKESYMERIAIISDIHGNMPALEAVLEDIESRGIERIICLGDLAGKGPSSAEVVDKIKEKCEAVVRGNWDYYMTDVHNNEALNWHQNKLGHERLKYMKELPTYKEFYMSGKLIRLCHASPNDIFHRVYISTDKSQRMKLFAPTTTLDLEADVVGYGDIHTAHIDHFGSKTIFNVGSVGNPLDMTQASYGIIEGNMGDKKLSPFTISIVRVPYDINLAVEQAELAEMPDINQYIKELKTAVYRGRKRKAQFRFNKYVFISVAFTAYALIGYMPFFKIKLSSPVQTPEASEGMYYFFQNLFHQWGIKIVVALITSVLVSMLISRVRK